MAAPATTLPKNAARCSAPPISKPPPTAAFALALADEDVDVDEALEVGADTAVKVCPAKEVVKPEMVPVASVIAGPPTEVTSTMGMLLEAVHVL